MADKPAAPYPNAVLLARVQSAHGLKGEVKVKIFTAEPEALRSYGRLNAGDGRELEISSLRAGKSGEALVQFKGFSGRDAADSLKGQNLFVPRSALPDTESEEFYHADLIGLRAEDESGNVLGNIVAVQNFGAGDVIEIVDDNDASHYVAFTREMVPVVDLKAKRVVVAIEEG
jgi:16S rRNA processing protein RimM